MPENERVQGVGQSTSVQLKRIYQDLPSPNTIRILTLLKRNPNDGMIRCQLRNVCLSDKLGYIALSYTWGSPESTRTIFVNEQPFEARANLYTALEHFCDSQEGDRDIELWVDAICL
jgi:hypothetical protein